MSRPESGSRRGAAWSRISPGKLPRLRTRPSLRASPRRGRRTDLSRPTLRACPFRRRRRQPLAGLDSRTSPPIFPPRAHPGAARWCRARPELRVRRPTCARRSCCPLPRSPRLAVRSTPDPHHAPRERTIHVRQGIRIPDVWPRHRLVLPPR